MKHINPLVVKAQVQSLLATCPELADDEEGLILSLESETDAVQLLTQIVERISITKAMAAGVGDFIKDMAQRQDRLEHRVDGFRKLAFQIMQAAGIPKLPLDIATLSIRHGRPKVIITDDKALPEECQRVIWEANKVKIKELLDAGQVVPGAVLSNAEEYLEIRTK